MSTSQKVRPAWIEIDLDQLHRNFALIRADLPANLRFLMVVKDNAYGHGAVEIAQAAINAGACMLGTVTVDEALQLRQNGISTPILVMGERTDAELAECIAHNLTPCINDVHTAAKLAKLAEQQRRQVDFHIEVDTGMSRYGVRWSKAAAVIAELNQITSLRLQGVMSHFAMSDELDKTFANQQLQRFEDMLAQLTARNISIPTRHMCNTGGFLDLPHAHFDMVRLGILPLGVYPSVVCRRIAGIAPIMAVKTRIAAIQELAIGDSVGYGMCYTAEKPHRLAVLPIGYGDGYPRVRNQGEVLIHGQRARIIGGNAMDAMMVDLSAMPQAQRWDEVVLQGKQGNDEISVHDIAKLKDTVSYDVLSGWRERLPRVYQTEGERP
ncbi:MAG: alanine racemase [Deferribacteres bacterium]|nr:alanine racemase [candidate division KSB1 bacterium]MCB9510732.1 alanine racemase [Deferribacteres bacterium]